ncbi:MAG: 16S rRNA (cytosine(967)-C(5))-methyltransferase RsmB [Eubacteriales bacterium]|nr:16S rRNA (cytosine(967)-C(5))-methyltransferase RsmB [Eubacteriales bacterium]
MDQNRVTAYEVLINISEKNSYSNIELNNRIAEKKPNSPPFVRELVYGVLKNQYSLDYIIGQLSSRKLEKMQICLLVILRMGLYQIIYMDSVPDYAAVDECVKLTKKVAFGRSGFINGVLRNFLRNRDTLKKPEDEKNEVKRLSLTYSIDPWIVRLWLNQYGERAEKLLQASNMKPRLCLRVNTLRIEPAELVERLKQRGVDLREARRVKDLLIVKSGSVIETPEFKEGLFFVQDAASALAVERLAPKEGSTIIDLCAAPGGKSLDSAIIMKNTGRVMSFDVHGNKLHVIEKSAERLGVSVIETREQDSMIENPDLIELGDYVICDAPCSGLGVLDRKPEIKYRKLEDDGRALAEKQFSLLETASKYVKRYGKLMYSTCTINMIENKDVVSRFLKEHSDFKIKEARQLMPDEDGTDGFFYCVMKRQ